MLIPRLVRRIALSFFALVALSACTGAVDREPAATTVPPAPTSTTVASTTEPPTPPTTLRPPAGPTKVDASLTQPDGRARTYRLYVPASLPDGPAPLLIAMHGGTGWGTQFEENSGFDDLAEANGFIVAYPNGIPIAPPLPSAVWNGGHCCGPAAQDRLDVDDVGFIADLIDTVEASYPIDSNRVFATGHSNGAIMAYRLACELSDRIVAVAFQAGSLEIDDCSPDQPVSVFHLHGEADTTVPLDGGFGAGISNNTDFNSPRSSVQEMAAIAGCADSTTTIDPDHPDVTRRTWEGCDAGTTVEMVIVRGANHGWMGHPTGRLLERIVGEPYLGFDSSAAIWDFLAAHPRL